MSITPAQRRMLHAARRQLCMSDETYRDVLVWAAAGVESSTEFDRAGFDRIVQKLERLGFKNTSPRNKRGRRPGMASDAQLGLLRRLWALYCGGDQADDAKLGAWLDRFFGVSAVRFLPADKASRAIDALRAMVARRDQAPPAA